MVVVSGSQRVTLAYDSPCFHYVLSNLFLLPLTKSGTGHKDFQSLSVFKSWFGFGIPSHS